MCHKFFIGFLSFILNIYVIKAIVINALIYTYSDKEPIYTSLAKDFNEYSKEMKLDIELNLVALTQLNSTTYIGNYSSMIETLIKKRSKKYDIYFYYGSYTEEYGMHFEDLKGYLSQEFINNFEQETIESVCTYKDKIVGFPVLIDIGSLYSNIYFLSKYNKKPPQTWDELIETSKYILKEEEKQNNTNLIAYNGLVNDCEEGIVSIYEFIQSYRENQNDPHPKLNSHNTMNALSKLKELKNEIASDSIFKENDGYFFEKLYTGTALFLKFWNIDINIGYQRTPLPGAKKGVSGTIVGGYNIAINRYVENENKLASIEVLKYILSKSVQKKYMINKHIFSAITSLYDDKEVCSEIDCGLVKKIQPFHFMYYKNVIYSFEEYNEKSTVVYFDYIYGNSTLPQTIKKVENLSKYYSLEIKTNDSFVGLIIFILYVLVVTLMLSSLSLLYIKKFKNNYKFLTKDCWFLSNLGTIAMLSSVMTEFYDLTPMKCKTRTILIVFGFIFSFIPIFYQLSVNFSSESNKVIRFIYNNKYKLLVAFYSFNILLIMLILTSNFKIQNVIIKDGESYQKCGHFSKFGKYMIYFTVSYGIIFILTIFTFIFLEWNIEESYYDLRFIISGLLMDMLSVFIYIVTAKIKYESYIIYKLIIAISIFIFSLSNYIFLYVIRIFSSIMRFRNEDEEFINSFLKKNIKYNGKSNTSINNIQNNSINRFAEYKSGIESSINDFKSEIHKTNIKSNTSYNIRFSYRNGTDQHGTYSNNNVRRSNASSFNKNYTEYDIAKIANGNKILQYHYRVSKNSN